MKINVSVIICTYNRSQLLDKCIESVVSQKYPKSIYEIIVIDDGSTDKTNETCRKYKNIRYFNQKNQGIAAARRAGVKKAKGRIIVFIDDDCIAAENWLKNLVESFEDKKENIAGIGGKVKVLNSHNTIGKYTERNLSGTLIRSKNQPPFLSTCNCAFKSSIIKEVGSFDPLFKRIEDLEISWRMFFKGYDFSYEPSAVIYHLPPKNLWELMKKYFVWGRYKTTAISKHWAELKKYNLDKSWQIISLKDIARLLLLPVVLIIGLIKIYKLPKKSRYFQFISLIYDAFIYRSWRLGMFYQDYFIGNNK